MPNIPNTTDSHVRSLFADRIGGEEYGIVYALNAANEKAVESVTQLVLSRPLVAAIADDEVLTMDFPEGFGEYLYEVLKNPGFTRKDSTQPDGIVIGCYSDDTTADFPISYNFAVRRSTFLQPRDI